MKKSNRPTERGTAQGAGIDEVAERVRRACLEAARTGFERASIDGLCAEGALEVALDAIRSLDLEPLVASAEQDA